jgi:Cof subfamily protein (haloacid dehalogenase superfamily)
MAVARPLPHRDFGSRLVACDLDGTLLDPTGSIRPAVQAAIAAVRAAGVHVVIATGRNGWSAAAAARSLGLSGRQIVMNGGAYLSPITGRVGWVRRLDCATASDALAFAKGLGAVPLLGFTDTHICARSLAGAPPLPDFVTDSHLRRVDDLQDYADAGPVRVFIPTPPSGHASAVADARDWFAKRASIVFGDESGFEVMAPGTNKGEALSLVATSLGLERHQVAAVGDGPNDREMLAYAGRSAALLPGPGAPLTKGRILADATVVVPSSEEDGVVDALRSFFPRLETLRPAIQNGPARPRLVAAPGESAA